MTDTDTATDPSAPPAPDASPPRPGRKLPHPAAIVTWLAVAVILITVLVTAAGHHSPAAPSTARQAGGTPAAAQVPVAPAPAAKAATTTTTVPVGSVGSPVPYAADGQSVATRAEVTVGGDSFAVTSPNVGSNAEVSGYGSLRLGVGIYVTALAPVQTGPGTVYNLSGTPGVTIAVAVPAGTCGLTWAVRGGGTPTNLSLPPGTQVLDVVWGLPAVVGTPTITAQDGIQLGFASSCTSTRPWASL